MTATAPQETDNTSVQALWQAYKSGGGAALPAIRVALDEQITENPQAAALIASQIIGDSPDGSDSEKMAIDVFKRAAACAEQRSPMSLVNMFHGCTQRMPEKAERVNAETRMFLGQISHAMPDRKFIN